MYIYMCSQYIYIYIMDINVWNYTVHNSYPIAIDILPIGYCLFYCLLAFAQAMGRAQARLMPWT